MREPEWSDEQVDLLLASRARVRGTHGHLMSEATSPDADPANPRAPFYYVGTLPVIDFAERARQLARDAYEAELGEGEHVPPWLIFPVERRESQPRV